MSIRKRKKGAGTTGSSSSGTSSLGRPARWWRARRCTMSQTSARCWTESSRRWRPGGCWWFIDWARERFDEATARWCFDRLPAPAGDPGWLQQRHDQWQASGLPWGDYRRAWAQQEGLHAGQDIVGELDARFDRQLLGYGPYFFPDLAGISEGEEQAAIDAGQIRANRIAYTGRRRREGPASRPGP